MAEEESHRRTTRKLCSLQMSYDPHFHVYRVQGTQLHLWWARLWGAWEVTMVMGRKDIKQKIDGASL